MAIVTEAQGSNVETTALDLVHRVLAGQESAFAEMVITYSPAMTQVCFVVCGDQSLADEAVAAAWPIVWRRLHSVRQPELLRRWLIAVAANEARKLSRSRRRRAVREVQMLPDTITPGHQRDADSTVDLANALARLTADDRRLIALRYIAGFNSSELADATGMSSSGVRARLGRLLQRLRSELGDD